MENKSLRNYYSNGRRTEGLIARRRIHENFISARFVGRYLLPSNTIDMQVFINKRKLKELELNNQMQGSYVESVSWMMKLFKIT